MRKISKSVLGSVSISASTKDKMIDMLPESIITIGNDELFINVSELRNSDEHNDQDGLYEWFIALLKGEVEIATLDDIDTLNVY